MSFFKRKSDHPHKGEDASHQNNSPKLFGSPANSPPQGQNGIMSPQSQPPRGSSAHQQQQQQMGYGPPRGAGSGQGSLVGKGPPPQGQQQGPPQAQGPATTQGQGQSQGMPRAGSGGVKAPAGVPTYPWSTRALSIAPTASPAPPGALLSPFPRYGLSLPPLPTQSGHLLIFGGLVRESVRNDLYTLDCHDFSTALVEVKGEVPVPRVGHASCLVRSVLIVWGGDTKTRLDEKQDEALYLFNIHTKEWTRITPTGASPRGRYGHAVCMHNSNFFVFGGQVDGEFMCDLWGFDLNTLVATPAWKLMTPANDPPPSRTGHIMVCYQDKLYIFGGTDGAYHYNDTWSYDVNTRLWTELQCIGYIPVPREGHAAALVDDVVYVFGGRDVNGKDLGDLAAFKISNQRWYMFQNMGPAPTGRSGHAMAAFGKQVMVLGGESNAAFAQPKADDPSLVHVLDTGKIKYPADAQKPQQQVARKSSMPAMNGNQGMGSPQAAEEEAQRTRFVSLGRSSAPPGQMQNQEGHTKRDEGDIPLQQQRQAPPPQQQQQQQQQQQSAVERAISPPVQGYSVPDRAGMVSPVNNGPPPGAPLPALGPPISEVPMRTEGQVNDAMGDQSQSRAGAPQRPKRDGDDVYKVGSRALSPTQQLDLSKPPRVIPNGVSAAGSPTESQFARTAPQGSAIQRAMSPRSDGAPPPDAFYYGPKSPVNVTFPNQRNSLVDSIKDSRAKDQEIAAGRQREETLRAVLRKAMQAGFTLQEGDMGDDELADLAKSQSFEGGSVSRDGLVQVLLRIKQTNADLRSELAATAAADQERYAESDRQRAAALQEAAFYRARVATLESGDSVDLNRADQERINELEEQLNSLAVEHDQNAQRLAQLEAVLESERSMRQAAEKQEAETLSRAEAAEEAHTRTREEHGGLQDKHAAVEGNLREHMERMISLSSVVQQHEADRDHYRSQFEEVQTERDEHLRLIEQAQQAVLASGSRADDLQDSYERSQAKIRELERELNELAAELDAKSREVDSATNRLIEVENAWSKSREEADSLRSVSTTRIGELLDSHKALRSDDVRMARGHSEKQEALSEEAASLRKMLNEAGLRVDAAQAGMAQHRQKALDLEKQHITLRAEMRTVNVQASSHRTEIQKLKELAAQKEAAVRARDLELTELQTRCGMFRSLLADSGIAVNEDEATELTSTPSRRLETQLREQRQLVEKTRAEADDLARQLEEAKGRERSTSRQLEKAQQGRSSSASGLRSPSPGSESRVAELERRMQEAEVAHKKKLATIESDYQTAVHYVKGTEKVFRRMKDEMTKQKDLNANLQAELHALQGTNGAEAGSRTRGAITSGRGTPTLEVESSRQFQKLTTQHADLQKRFEGLQEEMGALRDVCAGREKEVEVTRRRAQEAESQAQKLREEVERGNLGVSADGRPWEDIEFENSELRQENEVLTHKIGLLLDVDDGRGPGEAGGTGNRLRSASNAGNSDENSRTFENLTQEMHQWERTFSPHGEREPNGRRPSSDYSH